MDASLVVPFHHWRAQGAPGVATDDSDQDQDRFLRLSRLLHELWGRENQTRFAQFVREAFPERPEGLWRDLRRVLYELRGSRSITTHPEESEPVTDDEIANYYQRFVGIGYEGVITVLLSLLSDQPEARQ